MGKKIVFDTDVMTEYIYNSLLHRGVVPFHKDAEMIADIMFDYLLEIGLIDEIKE